MYMRQKNLHRLALSTLSSLLIFSAAYSHADDTEIFFGGPAIDSTVKPNVLFVLDNSGSMAWRTASDDSPQGSEESRLTILKRSFSDLINNARSINAGVMVLNPRSAYGNSRLAYPITDIDNASGASASTTASQPEILDSGDDATQIDGFGNLATINNPTLGMGYFPVLAASNSSHALADLDAFMQKGSSSCRLNTTSLSRAKNTTCRNESDRTELVINDNPALMLFSGLNIPAGSTVTSAVLRITPRTSEDDTRIFVAVEQDKTPDALNDNTTITGRSLSADRQITLPDWPLNGTVSLDILSEISTLQGIAPTTDAVQGIMLKLWSDNNNDRAICMRTNSRCDAAELPTLLITYTTATGSTETRIGALRFQNVGIPQGAQITSARIDFVPVANGDVPLGLKVRAEAVDDAAVFSNTTNLMNLVARPRTTAEVNWDADSWQVVNPAVHVAGPTVTSLVQEIVDRNTWCGNSAMAFYFEPVSGSGSRTARSIDGAIGQQPILNVQYTGGTSGCLYPIIETRISQDKNDAWENDNNAGDVSLNVDPLRLDRTLVGARFDNLPINRGAEVKEIRVLLTPDNDISAPSVSVDMAFENTANSGQFTANGHNLSNRSKTTGRTCTINDAGGGWTEGKPYSCAPASLKTDLQAIFAQPGWNPGNAVSLFLTPASDTDLNIRSYEDTPAESIRLRLKLGRDGLASNTSTRTVRQDLDAIVQAMSAKDGTPIVPTLNEATTYYRGQRSGSTSPMTSACQPNHLVLLTDGVANSNTDAARSAIASLAGSCTSDADDEGEECGRTLTQWIYANDLNGTLEGKQNVTVHTIGFALDASSNAADIKAFLHDIASPVDPSSTQKSTYTAANAQGLNDAFNRIIQSVMSVDSTFVSPGAAVNQFNRQSNKNEVYFALFKPQETNRWVGNVKRYALNSGNGEVILDADNLAAVDTSSGFFKTNARSFWTPTDDGNNTALGGVANQLPAGASRNAFTFLGNSPAGTPVALSNLADNNNGITAAMLGAADATERTELIDWARGRNADGTPRNTIGDPLHSVPRLVTYQCLGNAFSDDTYTQCATGASQGEDQSVFVGTNEGFVHAFSTKTGAEQLAFMPQELLGNIKPLKLNARSTSATPRKYGMDNTVAIWANDVNGNGVIYGGKPPLSGLNPGEFIYAYASMGRGGRSLYALDVTNRDTPQMLWFKNNSDAGFARLGQTWSTPVVTKIDVNGTPTQVLIFAGGYDPNQDNVKARTADAMGNAIYIVDATTGTLIWSASSATGHTLQLDKMLYSMPGNLRVIDLNRDGLADQFFAADMGGQVWRFFINNGNPSSSLVSPLDSGSGTADDGVFANVIPDDIASPPETAAQLESKLRRFYSEPSVALLTVAGSKTMVVSLGSGYRGHPLHTGTADRLYSFRTPIIYSNATHTVLTENALYDATDNLVQRGSSAEKAAAAQAFATTPGGWYIRLTRPGEKALSEAVTFSGKLFFNTYEPTAASNSCKPAQGIGRAYAINLYDATPVAQDLGNSPDARFNLLKAGGIPPRTIVLFPDSGDGQPKNPVVCVGTECTELKGAGPGATYWMNES